MLIEKCDTQTKEKSGNKKKPTGNPEVVISIQGL